MAISFVENPTLRQFEKVQSMTSAKALESTIFEMAQSIKNEIKKERLETKGALMHGGWTKNEAHYLAIYAVYCNIVQYYKSSQLYKKDVVSIPLIPISPIAKRSDKRELEERHAIFSDTESYVRKLEHLLNYYHLNDYE